MDWIYPRRRGPEWKQGWTGQTLNSMSTPPLQLLTIFAIVVALLWLSQHTGYKSHVHQSNTNSQLFIILLPLLIIIGMVAYSSIGSYRLRAVTGLDPGGGSSPLGVAILVVVVLVLVSYQSSFHSKWFGPLRSD